MNRKELSKLYFDATVRMRYYVTAFYDENMHTEEGEPIDDLDEINQAILELRQATNIELDLVREASKEFKQK
jgi:hypothetical protein|tara:strand:- start:1459 stop:1674 length:216 start_codon:yes stop_codon:yes gene_type:complete